MPMDWDAMSEAEREEANDYAYNAACDRLRAALYRAPGATMEEARKLAFAELQSDANAARADIARGERVRASRLDKRAADYARTTLDKLGLIEGFIFDAEI